MLTIDEYNILKQHIVERADLIDNRVLVITLGKVLKLIEQFVIDSVEGCND